MDGYFCEFEKRNFELFRILLFEENHWKSLVIFGTFWNQLRNFVINLIPVNLVKIGMESNCTIVNF